MQYLTKEDHAIDSMNPTYSEWDQQVSLPLPWVLSSLSYSILTHVVGRWPISEFLQIKALANAHCGHPMVSHDLANAYLGGPPNEYNAFVTMVTSRSDPLCYQN
ncbi:hypothetical protein RJT34_11954 [Clitoria ternatea]|uniref:Uncharacterized protein n=1 Tax=Clitoria ternatea TaxID=43366 RepID=A0AAN9JMW2_CLITE